MANFELDGRKPPYKAALCAQGVHTFKPLNVLRLEKHYRK